MQLGLIGKTLEHSFSKKYFEEKFLPAANELAQRQAGQKESLKNFSYQNFELKKISEFKNLLKNNPEIKGLNITYPYKEEILPFLDAIDEEAKKIGAVNCVKINNGFTTGYNTDAFGFKQSIKPFLEPKHNKALIFGTGGSSKAIAYSLKQINVDFYFVTSSKNKKTENTFFYSELTPYILSQFLLLINCTPLGMFPKTNDCPNIPYQNITPNHLAYDLIYNPEETLFLKQAKQKGALTVNGLSMLQWQAERSWEIWNNKGQS